MNKCIFNFTNTYVAEDYPGFEVVDFSNLSGTDMYLDDDARDTISKRISEFGYGGIHLIDSGNYHYMSMLFAEQINQPFNLIYFDNHTDMKPAMFDMLSCGSWAKYVLEKNAFLEKIVMIGPSSESISQVDETLLENAKLVTVSRECCGEADSIVEACVKALNSEVPLYISIDKDVLATEELLTNWDQGTMQLTTLLDTLKRLCGGKIVLGVDVCGLMPMSAEEGGAAYAKNMQADAKIINTMSML